MAEEVAVMGILDKPTHHAVLAEMLTSKRIGLNHERLIGEILIASARLNSWLAHHGKRNLSVDEWIEVAREIEESEDSYKAVWRAIAVGEVREERLKKLPDLEIALERTARAYRSMCDRFGAP